MNANAIFHCCECTHRFKNRQSETGYSCEVWGHDDFASDTELEGHCHKFKSVLNLDSLNGLRTLDFSIEAEEILHKLREIARDYGVATRADFLELLGLPSVYTDNKFGWLDSALEKCAQVIPTKLGYFIELPAALPIR